jgi:hypothetical protein
MIGWLKQSIEQQLKFVERSLQQPLRDLSRRSKRVWFNDERLNTVLQEGLSSIPYCGLIYAVDADGYQRSANITRDGADLSCRGQDLSGRPYLLTSLSFSSLLLSNVYLDRVTTRPCITALQGVGPAGRPLGFIAADFELRHLPSANLAEPESDQWRQIHGDPAIRGTLFTQGHVTSLLDRQIDSVVPIIEELICERSVFHAKIHYSSSRATFWRVDKPFHYRVHVLDEILDPSVCLAYPARPYPGEAIIPQQLVREILERFTMLRYIDDIIYLRSGSVNVINGMVGLVFSCDGSHYMKFDDFMDKGPEFWSEGSVVACGPAVHTSKQA